MQPPRCHLVVAAAAAVQVQVEAQAAGTRSWCKHAVLRALQRVLPRRRRKWRRSCQRRCVTAWARSWRRSLRRRRPRRRRLAQVPAAQAQQRRRQQQQRPPLPRPHPPLLLHRPPVAARVPRRQRMARLWSCSLLQHHSRTRHAAASCWRRHHRGMRQARHCVRSWLQCCMTCGCHPCLPSCSEATCRTPGLWRVTVTRPRRQRLLPAAPPRPPVGPATGRATPRQRRPARLHRQGTVPTVAAGHQIVTAPLLQRRRRNHRRPSQQRGLPRRHLPPRSQLWRLPPPPPPPHPPRRPR